LMQEVVTFHGINNDSASCDMLPPPVRTSN